MEKPKVVYLHFNKPGAPKGYPWTIHTSKKCISAKEVVIHGLVTTIYKPHLKENPRAFLRAKGFVKETEPGIFEIRGI